MTQIFRLFIRFSVWASRVHRRLTRVKTKTNKQQKKERRKEKKRKEKTNISTMFFKIQNSKKKKIYTAFPIKLTSISTTSFPSPVLTRSLNWNVINVGLEIRFIRPIELFYVFNLLLLKILLFQWLFSFPFFSFLFFVFFCFMKVVRYSNFSMDFSISHLHEWWVNIIDKRQYTFIFQRLMLLRIRWMRWS